MDLGLPVLIASWAIGLLILKLLIANSGVILGAALGLLGSLGSFLMGQPMGIAIGSLVQLVIVCALIWAAFRKILGKDSLPIKWSESVFRQLLRLAPQVAIWSMRTVFKAIAGKSKQRGAAPEARRD